MITLDDFLVANTKNDLKIFNTLKNENYFDLLRIKETGYIAREEIVLSPKTISQEIYKDKSIKKTSAVFRRHLYQLSELEILRLHSGDSLKKKSMLKYDSSGERINSKVFYYSFDLNDEVLKLVNKTLNFVNINNIDYKSTIGQSFVYDNPLNSKSLNSNRWNIISRIGKLESSSTEISKELNIDRSAISRHLKELKEIGFSDYNLRREGSTLIKDNYLTKTGLEFNKVIKEANNQFPTNSNSKLLLNQYCY